MREVIAANQRRVAAWNERYPSGTRCAYRSGGTVYVTDGAAFLSAHNVAVVALLLADGRPAFDGSVHPERITPHPDWQATA
jgi:hypothetical protein